MRHFKKHLGLSLILSGASMLGVQAYAADQNSYRSGSPYLKTTASHFSQCERQCAGDAQCRGWNFVRPNAGAATGICEFNSKQATPVSSTVSMSGAMNIQFDPSMDNVIQAGTNTIRIGTPNLNKPLRTVRQTRGLPQRKIIRKPVSRQINVQKTNFKQPVNLKPSLINPQASLHQNMPQDKATVRQTQQPTMQKQVQNQATRPATDKLTPEQAYYRDQYLAKKRQQGIMQQQQHQQYQQRQQPTRRQPARLRPNEQRPQMAPTNRRPVPYAQRPQPPQFRPQQRTPQTPLYGSLYDDLTKNMTQVPRPKTAPDNLKNPNAPLATSRAIPTKPVVTQPLTTLAIPDLVGG